MGEFVTVNGMILSSLPMGEYDRRLVILTKERGKLPVFAKGARRVNSALCGVTRVFAMGTFELYEGRSSYNIKGAYISNYFNELTSDYEGVYYGYYFAELAEYFTRENLDGGAFLNLLYCAFRALSAKVMPRDLIRYVYELKALVLNGEYPEVFACRHCGREENLAAFSLSRQGMLCADCLLAEKDTLPLSQSTIYALQFVIASRLEKLFSFQVSPLVLAELKMVMGRLMSVSVDKKMKSLEIIGEVQSLEKKAGQQVL